MREKRHKKRKIKNNLRKKKELGKIINNRQQKRKERKVPLKDNLEKNITKINMQNH